MKPSKDGSDERNAANCWPLVAEQSFAREFFHIVLNAGNDRLLPNLSFDQLVPCSSLALATPDHMPSPFKCKAGESTIIKQQAWILPEKLNILHNHKSLSCLPLLVLVTSDFLSLCSLKLCCFPGEEGIVMSELGRHLQFPIRTFHKPNYLKEFTTRLGLYACKEQRGKAVVVCVHAPQKLLDEYRQSHAPAGPWLQNGWLNAVHNAMDTGLAGHDAPADPVVPMIDATPLEGAPSMAQGPGMDEPLQQLEVQPGQQAEQSLSAKDSVAVEGMPVIPETEVQVNSSEEADTAQKAQVEAERRQRAEEEMQTMQPWISDQSKIALDRIRRLLEQLDDAGFLFKSALRRFLKVSVNSDTDRTIYTCMNHAGSMSEHACACWNNNWALSITHHTGLQFI